MEDIFNLDDMLESSSELWYSQNVKTDHNDDLFPESDDDE
jgi:hypothetical protein